MSESAAQSLLDAQLFGHESGAFTGASGQRKGVFERAHGGTLFLDELANTSLAVQEKILRVIEYGEFERLGGSQTIQVDVRLIAATNEDLPALGRAGKFREDLIDRLAFDVITLPPLRERAEDIMVLAEHYAVLMAKELDHELFAGFSDEVQGQLLEHAWPGNVRELKNVVERAVYQHPGMVVESLVFNPFASPWRPKLSPARQMECAEEEKNRPGEAAQTEKSDESTLTAAGWTGKPMDFRQHLQDYEIDLLRKAMEHCQFNQRKTAEFLNLSYHQLRGYLRKYDLLP